jgi:hypothetical protein
MDAQRSRRTRDPARKSWYAHYRQVRFARWFGFIDEGTDLSLLFRRANAGNEPSRAGPDLADRVATRPTLLLDGVLSRIS